MISLRAVSVPRCCAWQTPRRVRPPVAPAAAAITAVLSVLLLSTTMTSKHAGVVLRGQRGQAGPQVGLFVERGDHDAVPGTVVRADELVTAAAELNARPRKTLNWVTPADRFAMLLATTK